VYEDYDANGKVRWIRDDVHGPNNARSLGQVALYDDLGRLQRSWQCGGNADGTLNHVNSYTHDAYDNLQSKDNASYLYSPAYPHQVTSAGPAAVQYDANGNMVALPGSRTLQYDSEGRLVSVDRSSSRVATYLYDYSGTRVASHVEGTGTTFFFGSFDVHATEVVRHITAGDRVIASSRVPRSAQMFASAGPPPVWLAQVANGAIALGFVGLVLLLPGRRRLALFGCVPRRAIALAAMVFCLSHLAWPPVAAAQCDPPDLLYPTVFYHPDHLGTPQLLTNEDAVIVERLSHRPYGEVGRMEGQGTTDPLQSQAAFMFTGQRAADATGLIYFQARYYDPALGMFVSHDPARQFLSPYSYLGGNPLNGVDPDGALTPETWGLIIAVVLVLLSSVATGVQAGLNGASANDASAAGIISLGTGLGTLVAGGFLGAFVGPAAAPAASGAVQAAAQGGTQGATLAIAGAVTAVGGSVYSAVRAFQDGQYAIGAFAIVSAAAAVYGAFGALKGRGQLPLPEGALQSPSEPCFCTPAKPRTLVMLDYYPVAGAPFGATHADATIVNPDPTERSYVVAAGPAPANRTAGILGAQSGAVLATSGGSPFGSIEVRGGYAWIGAVSEVPAASTVVDVPLTFEDAVARARRFVDIGNAAAVRYSPFFTNSNSVAHSLPVFLGGVRPQPPIFAPASGRSFP
jgi:RHS repeat-associated protein